MSDQQPGMPLFSHDPRLSLLTRANEHHDIIPRRKRPEIDRTFRSLRAVST